MTELTLPYLSCPRSDLGSLLRPGPSIHVTTLPSLPTPPDALRRVLSMDVSLSPEHGVVWAAQLPPSLLQRGLQCHSFTSSFISITCSFSYFGALLNSWFSFCVTLLFPQIFLHARSPYSLPCSNNDNVLIQPEALLSLPFTPSPLPAPIP